VIYLLPKNLLQRLMDTRIKSGHDERNLGWAKALPPGEADDGLI
jgi:hypothetical protein